MSNVTNILRSAYLYIKELKCFRDDTLSKEDFETIDNIRKELDELVKPQGIAERIIIGMKVEGIDESDPNYLGIYGRRMEEALTIINNSFMVPLELFNMYIHDIRVVKADVENDSNVPKP